jgi:hypothetical protein
MILFACNNYVVLETHLCFILLLLMSLFPTWNRDVSKDREFGRDVSSVGDVSSMKSKTVCTFYCLNFQLSMWNFMCFLIFAGFLPKFWPETSSMQKDIITLNNPNYHFYVFNYSNLWQLFILALFIDKKQYFSITSYDVVVYELVERSITACLTYFMKC